MPPEVRTDFRALGRDQCAAEVLRGAYCWSSTPLPCPERRTCRVGRSTIGFADFLPDLRARAAHGDNLAQFRVPEELAG